MRRADIISSAVVTLFGLLVMLVVIPDWIPGHEDGSYGLQPADFPFVTVLIATTIAAMFFLYRITGRGEDDDGTPPLRLFHVAFIAGAAATMIVGFVLLAYIGFLAGGPFLLVAFMILMGERRILPIVLMATLLPLALWGFFWKLLQFPLP